MLPLSSLKHLFHLISWTKYTTFSFCLTGWLFLVSFVSYFLSTQCSNAQSLDIFSTYTHEHGDLIHSYNLNCIYVLKIPKFMSPEPQLYMSCCPLDTSTWVSQTQRAQNWIYEPQTCSSCTLSCLWWSSFFLVPNLEIIMFDASFS